MEPRTRTEEAVSDDVGDSGPMRGVMATSRLRLLACCAVLTALAFIQDPGRIIADTKLDLPVNPIGFLASSLHLWDPTAAFGQVQNQAYGYWWPIGPFFVTGHAIGLPPWVTQRLWLAVVMVTAFLGLVLLARALEVGAGWAQVLAGVAFALSPRMVTLLGPTSIEAWPAALAPWVLLPLVRGSRAGSVRRAAALSALAVGMVGGVNAVATLSVLPLGVVWLATRRSGPRRRAMLAWWTGLTALATCWWVVPLLMLGRYSPPFLDYIENAPVTTSTTDVLNSFVGTSDWVAFVSPDWRAGHLLVSTPVLVLDGAVIAALGLLGVCRRDNPERGFLFASVLLGFVIVGFGYSGTLHGLFAGTRQDWLDTPLAPFRNAHKFDPLIRVPLALGLAHLVTVAARGDDRRDRGEILRRHGVTLVAGVAVVGVAAPVWLARLPAPGSFERIPPYWFAAARWLENQPGHQRALAVPARAFGDYIWGHPHDDVLEPIAESPWAVRNVIPLATAGNIRMLDAVTGVLEGGMPSAQLANFLANQGVTLLVVANDLDPSTTAAPDPVLLHQTLDRSPGLTKVATFGPSLGTGSMTVSDDGTRVFANGGRRAAFRAVEIYRVGTDVVDAPPTASTWLADTIPVVSGSPSSALTLAQGGNPASHTILAGDMRRDLPLGRLVLTDGLRRQEVSYADVRDNHSQTLRADDPSTLHRAKLSYQLYPNQASYETTASFRGVEAIDASTSQSDAATPTGIDIAASPAAAMDGDPTTSWQSSSRARPEGQWWEVHFGTPTDVGSLSVAMGASSTEVDLIRISTDRGSTMVRPGRDGALTRMRTPAGRASWLRIDIARASHNTLGQTVRIAEVTIRGVAAQRVLRMPDPFNQVADLIEIDAGDGFRAACARLDAVEHCNDLWRRSGEEGSQLNREWTMPASSTYRLQVSSTATNGAGVAALIGRSTGVRASVSSVSSQDPSAGAYAMIDDDPATTWIASPIDTLPTLRLSWARRHAFNEIHIDLRDSAPASRARLVEVEAGGEVRRVSLDGGGSGRFRNLIGRSIRLRIVSSTPAVDDSGGQHTFLPPGITELSFGPRRVIRPAVLDQVIGYGCGSGPTIAVNGTIHHTALLASPRELLGGETLTAAPCNGAAIELAKGTNAMAVRPSVAARASQVRLVRGDWKEPAPVRTDVRSWGVVDRAVEVAARPTAAVLVVPENQNDGWHAAIGGEELEPVRVDGWEQGFVVPAGGPAIVTLHYGPDPTYRAALAIGPLGIVVVLLLALGRRRAQGLPVLTRVRVPNIVAELALLAALGVIGGAAGFAVGAAAVATRFVLPRAVHVRRSALLLEEGAWIAAAGALACAAVFGALQVAVGGHVLAVTAQVWVLLALALAGLNILSPPTLRVPNLLRRIRGRSSTA
jgi:arabinofuranan 3-O-arabinosyltransferase